MQKGTIVLTKFPFTDLSSNKRRPAIIVSGESIDKMDVIVAFITTSQIQNFNLNNCLYFDIDRPDFKISGLKNTSVIRLDKLATLKKSIFTGELGKVGTQTIKEINEKLRNVFQLN